MKILLLPGAFSTPVQGAYDDFPGDTFLDLIGDQRATPSELCETEGQKADGNGFVLAQYLPGAQSKKYKYLHPDSQTEIFCFDIDSMSPEDIGEALPIWMEHNAVLYSTYSYSNEHPKFRLLVALDEPVRHIDGNYKNLYRAAAELLKVQFDTQTISLANLFFGPQHNPQNADDTQRYRFKGRSLCVSTLKELAKDTEHAQAPEFDVAGDRPDSRELKALAKKLKKYKKERVQRAGLGLEAILRKEAFAPAGSRHAVLLHIAFEITREFRLLDADWFWDTYINELWESLWPDDSSSKRRGDWSRAVAGAVEKHYGTSKARAEERDAVRAKPLEELTQEQIEAALDMRGRLVMSYHGIYFVYSARCGMYKGPFKASEVAVAVRDNLGGVPGVSEHEFTKAGPILKSAAKLNYEYGTTADSVMYWPKRPPGSWDEASQSICLQAYKWIHWEPVYHQIAADLLQAIGGKHYEQLEAYLTQFRNLDQPLPALTFIGPKGTWKSKICSILSRFWTNPHAPSPGKAEKILKRFNSHLLQNPVVWSDEKLAVTEYGKPQPEAYRASITDKTQQVEMKGVDGLVTLVGAVRHVIAVNNDDKVFSNEVDADSVYATMERFLLMYTDAGALEAFEEKWKDSEEMKRLRSGESLLEHIRWLEYQYKDLHEAQGRLFVVPHTGAQVLMRARYSDELLVYIWQVVFHALENEVNSGVTSGIYQRLPLIVDDQGEMRFSPGRVHALWSTSKATVGSGLRKPTAQKIGRVLSQAGFKQDSNERAAGPNHGWKVDKKSLYEFINVSDVITKEFLVDMLFQLYNQKV